jgi:predicted secreted protein
LYPMRSREEAERAAREHNEAMAPLMEKYRENPNYPCPEAITAIVVEWPHADMTDEAWERACVEAET